MDEVIINGSWSNIGTLLQLVVIDTSTTRVQITMEVRCEP